MGLKAMAFALVLQFSTNWAMKTYTMAAGQFAEFILTRESSETQSDDVNYRNTSLIEDMNDIFN